MDYQFKENLQNILKKDGRFYQKENNHFFKNKITECALNLDDTLIELLLSHNHCRKKFFRIYKRNNKEITIFDKDTFIYWINHHEFLPDSYTKFKQNIGLSTDGDKLLRQSRDVSLIFPYKDCVLQGGQTKEDAKRNEIFYNEVLAPDQIDKLLDKKVLTNFKRIDQNGEHNVNKDDLKNITEQNLIIKGNNLLALHSLKHLYRGKVKLIYIDPPYNTGSDGFKYNDNFNHSTWLVFMKNRLEVAKEFLRDDGVIFVQCDDNEQAYLKVLMDDVFRRENFIANLIWRKKSGGGQDAHFFAIEHENIIVYNKNNWKIFDLQGEYTETEFNKTINNKKAKILKLEKWGNHSYKTDRPSLYYPIKDPDGNEFYPSAPDGKEGCWRKKPENLDEKHIHWERRKTHWKPYEVIYFEEVDKKTIKQRSILLENGSNTEATNHIKKLFNRKEFSTPKPERLLQRIIEISTKENDIILDYHLGSGTTAAVAHKMGRRYIGIEQMDYIENVALERMKKVIGKKVKKTDAMIEGLECDTGGISKVVDWKGGGEFLYFELAEYNQKFIRKIKEAKNTQPLLTVYEEMNKNGFLSYQFDDKNFKKNINDFKNFTLKEQKNILIELLDKNMLYLNYKDIKDKKYGVDKKTIELNKQIYGRTKNRRTTQIELYQRDEPQINTDERRLLYKKDEPQINTDERRLNYIKGMNHR